MKGFATRVPRLTVTIIVIATCLLISPEDLSQGPALCIWRHILATPSCPACGSSRALAAFFHGRFREALQYNFNVLVTAPTLLILLAIDTLRLLRNISGKWLGPNGRKQFDG